MTLITREQNGVEDSEHEQQYLAPEDEELLRDDEVLTPVKPEGIRKKERPTDKGMSWLVKTQYISPLSTDAAKMVMPADSSINIVTYIVCSITSYILKG